MAADYRSGQAAPPVNLYDALVYPGHSFPQTHPRTLATIAHFHGMNPAPLSGARVLELGCGTGGNLVPMALRQRDAHFVGVDLSGSAIAAARASAAAFGLNNVVFHQADIGAISREFGTFDYIICHGVYSWVPPAVRENMMALYGALLAPQGVGYISFNALPGSHLRDLGRNLVLFKTRKIEDPHERVRVAREVLKEYAAASDEKTYYGTSLRLRLEHVETLGDDIFFHDDLNPGAQAFLVHEVLDAAARVGLQFLQEATFPNQFAGMRTPIQNLLRQIPDDDVVEREQSFDLLIGRSFRETLFCRADAPLDRKIRNAALRPYHLAANVRPHTATDKDELRPGAQGFNFAGNVRLVLDLPQCIDALHRLSRAWPAAIPYAELAGASLVAAAGSISGDRVREQDRLDEALIAMFKSGLVDIHLEPPTVTGTVSERPLADVLVRAQAEEGPYVTNLYHRSVALDGPIPRKFVSLLDGSRDAGTLLAEMNAFLDGKHAAGGFESYPRFVTAEEVSQHLADVAEFALLVS